MSGITMSPEEAAREAQEREREQAAAAASTEQEKGKEREQGVGWSGSIRRRSTTTAQIPPIPNYQPPPPPTPQSNSGLRSPESEAVIRKAEHEAQKSPRSEDDVPERILKTTSVTAGLILPGAAVATASPSTANTMKHGPQTIPHIDRRESAAQTVLPVVEEAGEGSSTGERSRNSHLSHLSSRTMESDGRPLTPAKDGEELEAGFGNPILSHTSPSRKERGSPPTPPTSGYLKPESADSGYGVSGNGGRSRSGTAGSGAKVKVQLSRESLDKALPPLPKIDGAA